MLTLRTMAGPPAAGDRSRHRQRIRRGMADPGRARDAGAAEQAARLHVRLLLLGQAGRLPPFRVLRERRQGDPLGIDHASLHAGIFRQPHASTELLSLEGPRPRAAGPPDPPDALRPGERPLRAVRLGRGLRGDRAGSKRSIPKSVVFYASGRASLETSYLYALFARMYGNNNLPDSSNMCHETTSVALKKADRRRCRAPSCSTILRNCDAIFFFGQNTGSNSPRFLHPLQDAAKRACRSSPSIRCGRRVWKCFVNPQNPGEMLTGTAPHQHAVPPGAAPAATSPRSSASASMSLRRTTRRSANGRRVLDADFIEQPYDTASTRSKPRSARRAGSEIEADVGPVARGARKAPRDVYIAAEARHRHLRHGPHPARARVRECRDVRQHAAAQGQYRARRAPGISPVRGHSNVQGQRTVGIAEKPELVPLDKIARAVRLRAAARQGPEHGRSLRGHSRRARSKRSSGSAAISCAPSPSARRWRRHGATCASPSRSRPSSTAAIWSTARPPICLPCLGRTEEDMQASGPQAVSMEDTFSCIHGSIGRRKPASEHLKSEVAIVAGIAKATLPPNPK